MTTTVQSSRLAAIQITGYRGFPQRETVWLASHDASGKPTGKGKNLLLYGENGSGKSSLGRAIRDFLDFRATAPKFDDFKYRFTDPPGTDRGITLVFDDPAIPPLTWNPTSRDTAHREFSDMARARGWLDYREVWRASEVPIGGDSVEVFKPLVESILPGCLPPAGGASTFGQLWDRITAAATKRPTRTVSGKAKVEDLQSRIKAFNALLEAFLPHVETQANDLLQSFSPWSSIVLKWKSGADYNSRAWRDKFTLGSVRLQMKDRGGDPLRSPSEFLNEARLTAMGLCLYLAGLSQSIPPRRADGSSYPRLLVLDDVLLSLDMIHRQPLLKLLKRRVFRDWQILLLTHDRAWYEIAKQQLGGEHWAHCELFAQRVGDYDQPLLREDQDHLLQAIDFLHHGHVKAAAVHVRTKFEEVLKNACSELRLPVRYQPDPRKLPAKDLWDAVSGATWEDIPTVGRHVDGKGKVHWWQPPPVDKPLVPPALKDRIAHALKWVMNPLSHSQCVDRYLPEIEDAILAIAELETAIHRAIAMQLAGPVLLREMLLAILRSRAEPSTPSTCNQLPSSQVAGTT